MIDRITLLVAGIIALSGVATFPALADVYYVTYTGTASGTDTNGVFGAAGQTLSNAAFISTYTYDPSQFGNAVVYTDAGHENTYGGSSVPATDPILSATLRINGIVYSQGSAYEGAVYIQGGPDASHLSEFASSSYSNYLSNDSYVNGTTTLSFTALQSFSVSSGGGNFKYSGENLILNDTYVSVTDGPAAAIPEPASLALLGGAVSVFVLAFNGCRATARRRSVDIDGFA